MVDETSDRLVSETLAWDPRVFKAIGDTVSLVVGALAQPGETAESILEKLSGEGVHHQLLETWEPGIIKVSDREYSEAIDAFDGDLEEWVKRPLEVLEEERKKEKK